MELIIYGAGLYGKKILSTLDKYPEYNVIGYADSYKTGSFQGYPIIPIDKSKEQYTSVIFIIALGAPIDAITVYDHLNGLGYKNIYYYLHKEYCSSHDFLNRECIKLDYITCRDLLYAEMHIIDYCNLNCKGCTHFSALFKKETPDTQQRIMDVKRLSDIFNRIMIFNMMGGEPLLNPKICDYITGVRRILPDSELQITTNGLYLPQLDSWILRYMAENSITVVISEYAPTHKIIHIIRERLETYGIDYCIRAYEQKQRFAKPLTLCPDSRYPHKCISNGCVNIWEGKIARCPTLMYINQLNERFGLSFPAEGIMNLYQEWDSEELMEKLKQTVPLCKYCVECEMDWERCGKEIKLEDFVTDK